MLVIKLRPKVGNDVRSENDSRSQLTYRRAGSAACSGEHSNSATRMQLGGPELRVDMDPDELATPIAFVSLS